jgi:hypothetical protein
VGTGHVYITPRLVSMMVAEQPEAACREYLTSNSIAVSRRLFRERIARIIEPVLTAGAVEELNEIGAPEPGRRFHLFLMLSDQRHHLTRHFESILEHRTELELPFFDSRFLETVLEVPVEDCLRHRFYYRWLEHFPAAVRSVPWQAYPGHLPCTVPWPEKVPTQWEKSAATHGLVGGRRAALKGMGVALRRDFPGDILRRSVLGVATALTAWGITGYAHIAKTGLQVCKYWMTADGKTVLDWPA